MRAKESLQVGVDQLISTYKLYKEHHPSKDNGVCKLDSHSQSSLHSESKVVECSILTPRHTANKETQVINAAPVTTSTQSLPEPKTARAETRPEIRGSAAADSASLSENLKISGALFHIGQNS